MTTDTEEELSPADKAALERAVELYRAASRARDAARHLRSGSRIRRASLPVRQSPA